MEIWCCVVVFVLYVEVVDLFMLKVIVGDVLLVEFKMCFVVFFDFCEVLIVDVGYMFYYDQLEQVVVLIEVFCLQC